MPVCGNNDVHRLTVWNAMSELFLDTELSDADMQHIAATLAKSPYSLDELDVIYHGEIFPILSPNLLATVGVWDGFDMNWVSERIGKLRHKKMPGPVKKWWRVFCFNGAVGQWEQIKGMVRSLRASGACTP